MVKPAAEEIIGEEATSLPHVFIDRGADLCFGERPWIVETVGEEIERRTNESA